MLINEFMDMAADVPPMISIAWAAWLAVGLVLTIWHRRARAALVVDADTSWRSAPRPRSGVRPSSGVRPPSDAKRPLPVPAVNGDPFGELETMLEQPAGTHRTPGESPILSSAGSPILRASDEAATSSPI